MMPIPAKALLEIDFLRKAAKEYGNEPYCFGLGFIQLKLSPTTRIHFWHENIPHVEREEIHNHRYNFTSHVLAGKLAFSLYDVAGYANIRGDVPEWERFDTKCEPGKPNETMPVTTPVHVRHMGDYRLTAGSIYKLPHTAFHTTEETEFAITFLERDLSFVKAYASVVKKHGTVSACPFANPGTPEEAWELINQALNWAKLGC